MASLRGIILCSIACEPVPASQLLLINGGRAGQDESPEEERLLLRGLSEAKGGPSPSARFRTVMADIRPGEMQRSQSVVLAVRCSRGGLRV